MAALSSTPPFSEIPGCEQISFHTDLDVEVVDYCLADVCLTKRLLDRVIRSGQIINPKTGEWILVRKPGA